MAKGTIRYWAAAKAAAGVDEEPFDAPTLEVALAQAARRSGRSADFDRVVRRSSFLVDGAPVGTRPHGAIELSEGAVIEVLPPFAGG
ncbi:MoaD/ThiS family protein [Actinomadura sp. SCN-SB]|uniref:MoaD/ThiS family protein n=1 Tax=Actinomadura sp. SCN-SB TaxID=3373092 RepID=UPI003753D0FB